MYGSISFFAKKKKTENEAFKIISPEKLLEFFVNRDKNKESLNFQLTKISGELQALKDKKIHNFSLTRIGQKRKLSMQEPAETIIIWAQQNLEIAGRLNPVKTEIEDDRVVNKFKKHKNVVYKLTPPGILIPASIKNNTEEVFITCREIKRVKKNILINRKIFDLIGIIDPKKINNWSEIKGQSIWVNATLGEQKEINSSRHLCFPFPTKTLNDLLSFSTYLIDYNNEEITFKNNEKK